MEGREGRALGRARGHPSMVPAAAGGGPARLPPCPSPTSPGGSRRPASPASGRSTRTAGRTWCRSASPSRVTTSTARSTGSPSARATCSGCATCASGPGPPFWSTTTRRTGRPCGGCACAAGPGAGRRRGVRPRRSPRSRRSTPSTAVTRPAGRSSRWMSPSGGPGRARPLDGVRWRAWRPPAHDRGVAARARAGAPVAALRARAGRSRGPDHRARRGLPRLGRPGQPLPRRPLGALLQQHRPRAGGRRPGGGRPGQGARLLHHLGLPAPALDRAGDPHRRARAGGPRPRVPHQRRERVGRLRDQARAPLPPAGGQAHQDQAHRAHDVVPRHHLRGDGGHGAHLPPRALRADGPRRLPRPGHQQLPPARGPLARRVRRGDRGAHPVRGARHGGRRDHRAGPERRRLHPGAPGLLRAGAGDLRRVRRPHDLRRGDLLLGPAGRVVRLPALRLRAGPDHDGQGAGRGVRGDGRGDRLRTGSRSPSPTAARPSCTGSRSAATR